MELLHFTGIVAFEVVRNARLRRLSLWTFLRRAGEPWRRHRENTKERSMGRVRVSAGFVCLVLVVSLGRAGPPPQEAPADDVAVLAARIDQLIEAGCIENSVKPAPLADDAEFVRRDESGFGRTE